MAGILVLKDIGRLILALVPESDSRARYEGNEFAIILPNRTAKGQLAKLERTAAGAIKKFAQGPARQIWLRPLFFA